MAHPLRIQRKRTKGYRLPKGAVCVHRPTKWGNPYCVDQRQPRQRAVALYKHWLVQSPAGVAIAEAAKRELRGKMLACWCPLDRECHADVLCELANTEGS